MNKKEIAVIGMAGRFPGAQNIGEFWKNLKNGAESITFLETEELKAAGVEEALIDNPDYVPAKGILADHEYFDSYFFGYTPVEAAMTDPQVRIFLQCCWHALEDAGYDPGAYPGAIGVFAGASPNPFWEILPLRAGTGDGSSYSEQWNAIQFSDKDYLSTRVAYKLDLRGPCVTLQTACSTSLAAVDQAIHSLLSGACDMALAGGVSITLHDETGYLHQEGTILSPDGHCRPFSRDANGTVGGNGCGVVVLKRLEDARQDGDRPRAIIIGTGVTNDGKHKAGFTAPSSAGQARAIRGALEMAGASPDSIGYIETHGTGTPLGDPIEIGGLKAVFGGSLKNGQDSSRCALGSVKSNIGHLDAAAGIAGLIKTVLILEHRFLPPTLHFNGPNPSLELENSPFYVNTGGSRWPGGSVPFRAGVSSFGLGGTNVHILLEEWTGEKHRETEDTGKPQLFILSAKTAAALEKMSANLARHFSQNPDLRPEDAAYTLQLGRQAFNHRQTVLASSIGEAVRKLESGDLRRGVVKDEYFEDPDPGKDHAVEHPLVLASRSWLQGAPIDWRAFHEDGNSRRIPLPLYPFEADHYPVDKDLFNPGLPELSREKELRKNPDMAQWFYVPSWERKAAAPAPPVQEQESSSALIFTDSGPLGDVLRERLEKENPASPPVTVKAGDLEAGEAESYERLVEQLVETGRFPSRVYHLWSNVKCSRGDSPALEHILDMGFYSLLYLVQALMKHAPGKQEKLEIIVVSGAAHEVTGSETLRPEYAPIYGLCKVLPQEYPAIAVRAIDIPIDQPPSHRQVRQWLQELLSNSSHGLTAFRGNYRWHRTFQPLRLTAPQPGAIPLKEGGIYLITGGTGAIGTILARHLAEKYRARLVLTCRSAVPDRDSPGYWKLREIESLGGGLLVLQADVSDRDQMQEVFRLSRETFGALDGVIHAAGIVGPRAFTALRDMGKVDAQLHFKPKIGGLLVLEKLLAQQPVDFCLVMSSTSSILGGLGFAAYSAANYFMDAYIHHLGRGSGTRWLSINWDGWQLDQQPVREDKLGEIIARLAMTPAEGMAVLERVLACPEAVQVVQCSGHLQTRIERWLKPSAGETEPEHDAEAVQSASRPRPPLANAYIPPQTPLEKELAGIWQDLLGYERVGIEDSFFDLNGDSLKAVIAISRIQKQTGKKVSLKDFFAHPTITGLTGDTGAGAESREKPGAIPLLEQKEYYPLSSAQTRMYLLDRLGGESNAYHVPMALEVTGELDCELLQEIFRRLIRRHEVLRTSFFMVEDQPVQKVHNAVEFSIENIGPIGPIGPIKNTIPGFIRPFDPAQAPLLRVGLAELAENKHLLLLDMHHIVSDGTSMTLLLKEFLQLYRGDSLPEQIIQYKEYARWQNAEMSSARLKEQGDFWLKELAGQLPVLDLPYDFPRPREWRFEGRQHQFQLEAPESAALKELAQKNGVTLYMVLVSVYTILLAKLGNTEEIVLGAPVAGRSNADLQDLIGLFVNTLAIRTAPRGKTVYYLYLEELKKTILAAFENQDYPFEAVVEQLTVTRDPGRNPLFDTAFVFQNMEIPGTASTGLTLKPFPVDILAAKLDLSLIGEEIEDTLRFTFEYSTALFTPGTMERFSRYFQQVVSAILSDARQEIGEIEIITPEEKHQVLEEFNNTNRPFPGPAVIHELFQEQAEKTGDQCSVISGQRHITYGELNRRANRLAHHLQEKGVGPGSIVAIMMERSLEMVTGILGILKSGAAYLPIAGDLPQDRIDYMLKDSNAALLLTSRDIAKRAGAMNCAPTTPTQLCYIIYTSGSTGRPKGVMVEHGGVVNMVRFHKELFKEDTGSRISQVSSISFDAMAFEVFPCLCAGAALCIVDDESRLDPGQMKDWLIKHHITISFQSTAMAQQILQEQWPGNCALKILRTAGDRLNAHPVHPVPFRFFNLYGPTEDTIWTTWYEVPVSSGGENTPPPIGKPAANKQVYILDKHLNLQPPGIGGELCISGGGVARGYLNRPQLTAQRFVDFYRSHRSYRTYKTGDLARWLPDGNIQFLGRIDHQVKVRGFRIELGEIENRLQMHPGIAESVVIAREDPGSGTYLCAYYTGCEDGETSTPLETDIKEYLSRFLPDYMVPPFTAVLETMPYNTSGKIDRRALPLPSGDSVTRLTLPRIPLEQKLAALWREVLPKNHARTIGIDDNFFALGGHSITAAALASRIQKKLDIKLPLSQIFKNPTIRQLAGHITGASRDSYAPLEAVEQKEYYPLSSAQTGLFTEHYRDTHSTGYNVQAAVLLEGVLDRKKLQDTFKQLIRRHEILRTSFQVVGHRPVQIVHEDVDFSIEEIGPMGPIGPIKDIIPRSILSFDLEQAPLMRVRLIRTDEEKHIVTMDLHHIIMDGTSIGIFFREFMSLYSGSGEESLPGLRVQYKDFAEWQEKQRDSGVFKELETYWLKEFSGEAPHLLLATDLKGEKHPSAEGNYIEFTTGGGETGALRKMALDFDASLFMVLISIYYILLSRLSGQEDITVGMPLAGRGHGDLEPVLGHFVNTLPLRNFPGRDKEFGQFLREVRERVLMAFDHQDYPFGLLTELLRKNGATGGQPLYNVLFVFQGDDILTENIPRIEASGLRLTPCEEQTHNAPYDIIMHAFDNGEKLGFRIIYRNALFTRETVENMAGNFRTITSAVLADKNIKLENIVISHSLLAAETPVTMESEGGFNF